MTKKTKEIADKIFNNPREEPDTIMCNEDVEVVKVLHSEEKENEIKTKTNQAHERTVKKNSRIH